MTPAAAVGSAATTTDNSQCQICHTRPAREGGAICWVCLGSEASDPAPAEVAFTSSTNAYVGEIICPKCKKPHDGFLINGRGKTKTCRDCIVAKRKATWTENKGKHKRRYAEEATMKAALPIRQFINSQPTTAVLLNFSNHPELLSKIQQIAKFYMRTPEAQILWMILSSNAPKTDQP